MEAARETTQQADSKETISNGIISPENCFS